MCLLLLEVFVLETDDGGEVEDQREQIASLLLDLQSDDTEENPAEVQSQPETQKYAHFEERWVSTDEDGHSPSLEYNKVCVTTDSVCIRSMQ